MRKRRYVAAAAAAVLAASAAAAATAIATAGENDERPQSLPEPEAVAVDTVTLPTGDMVRQWPSGALEVVPAEGRESVGFIGKTATDGSGDVVVIPADKAADLQSGAEDVRRYNVSKMLEDGFTDAAAVPESELDARAYVGLAPVAEAAAELTEAEAAASQTVTVKVLDRSGAAPENALLSWVRTDGTEEDTGEITLGADGTGTADLPAGAYLLTSLVWNAASDTERGEATYGFTAFTVDDAATEVVVDAAAAQPITVDVEREDAELTEFAVQLAAQGEVHSAGVIEWFDGNTDAYLLPRPDTDDYEFQFTYQPELEGAADPYTYHLAFGEYGAYPSETAFSVTDAELAVEHTEFQDWGVELPGRQCDYPLLSEQQGVEVCLAHDLVVPSERTMLYTAESVTWTRDLKVGQFEEYDLVDGYSIWEDAITLEAGETERVVGGDALSAGLPIVDRLDVDGYDQISGAVFPAATYGAGELVWTGYAGDVTLSKDGETIGTTDILQGWGFDLPEGDKGRYTLEVTTEHGTATGLYATESDMTWEFDSTEVTDENASLALPVVLVDAEGVENGTADAAAAQAVTLTMSSVEWAEDTTAEQMTFEVSYDDGATWTEVPIALEGDTATASLEHPEGAEFVSTRLTAVDDAGTEVNQTVIRSWGLS